MSTVPAVPNEAEIEYPSSDGKPMAETDVHRELMFETIALLKGHFAADPQVYVSGNLMVYYVRGNPRRYLAPDTFVVRGVPRGDRTVYKIWQEGKAPECVIEFTSASTRLEDEVDKFMVYRDVWGTREYFLFDPLKDYLDPPFRGYRLEGGRYEPIEPIEHRLPSEVLGLHLQRRGKKLVLWDPAAGEYVSRPEVREARAAEAARLKAEAELQRQSEARVAAEAELERLRRELEALRRQPPPSP